MRKIKGWGLIIRRPFLTLAVLATLRAIEGRETEDYSLRCASRLTSKWSRIALT